MRGIVGLGALALATGCYVGPELAGETGSSGVATAAASGTAAGTTAGTTAMEPPEATGATATSAPVNPTTAATTAPEEMSSGTGATEGPATTGETTGAGETTTTTTGEPPPDPAAMVCQRWNADRADTAEGAWSGDAAGCQAGEVAAPGRENVRKLVNLYRALAGLPPVELDAGRSDKAQACALMMHANGALSHSPPMNWKCYSAAGAEAAGKSNISGGPGVSSVNAYMIDDGNATTFGHRRWILANSLGPIGAGSTSQFSCLWVIGGQGDAGAAWTAWPPAGIVPIEALHVPGYPWATVNDTGWTIQSDGIDVTKAQVTITEGGADRPVKLAPLLGGYGSQYAISWTPQGWTTAPGKTYAVQVSGVPQPFSYEVTVVQCE